MKILIKCAMLICLATITLGAYSQSITVGSYDFVNDVVEVNYSATVERRTELRNVTLYAVINGKSTKLRNVEGALGTIRESGNYQIKWRCFKELGTEPISGEVYFEIKYDRVEKSSYSVSVWNMFVELNYTPSVPFTAGFGLGKRLGIYARYGKIKENSTISGGMYFKVLNWLSLNAGYNYLNYGYGQVHGYEVGGTILLLRKRWLGLNMGYIGTFKGGSEFQLGLTFNLNLK